MDRFAPYIFELFARQTHNADLRAAAGTRMAREARGGSKPLGERNGERRV